jgi:hypothetical protein
MVFMLRVCSLLFVLLFCFSSAEARLLPFWPHAKLKEKSDLIVIGNATETKTFNEKIELDWGHNVYLQSVVTTFKVHDKMKGECGKQIEVIHYQLKTIAKGKIAFIDDDGPTTISFPDSKDRDYVLYLKKRKDDRYLFVSGIEDPQFSAQEIKRISVDTGITD